MTEGDGESMGDGAQAVWRSFEAFGAVLDRTIPYSTMGAEAKARIASDLTVALEARRGRLATERLLEALTRRRR